MSEISLRVTSSVLSQLGKGRKEQRQIALTLPSQEIAEDIGSISAKNRRLLLIGNCIPLVLADRSALWRAHNADRVADFDALFELLARRPDQEMRVLCKLQKL